MHTVKVSNCVRPELFIQVQNHKSNSVEINESCSKNQVITKPLRSAKNTRELKQFNFPQNEVDQSNTGKHLKKLKKLEDEKATLMQSLTILKQSAVSAIAQKEDCIQKLKLRDVNFQDDSIELFERQLEEGKQIRIDLEEQKERLRQQLHQQREQYIAQLEQKQYLIEQLYHQIQDVRRDLQLLEQTDFVKTTKIKLLLEQNSQLSEQLQNSSSITFLRERGKTEQIIDLDQSIKAPPSLSVSSSPQSKTYISYADSEHYFQSEADKSFMVERLEEMEKFHKDELLDLKGFYQKRISSLRQIYQRQLHLHSEESERDSRSRKDSRSSNSVLQRSPSGQQIDPYFQLNLKDMYSIEQMVQNEIETSRSNIMNLKSELIMQNLSECPGLEPRLNTNEDTESQFTTKYFQPPTRFTMVKNKSAESFNLNNQMDSKTIFKVMTKKSSESNIEIMQKKQPKEESSFLKNSYIFAAGLISGAAATSIVGYFLKKEYKF